MKNPKILVNLIRNKIQNEDQILEYASLFDIDIDLDLNFIHQRIQFTILLNRLIKSQDDFEFYSEMLN